MDILRMLEQLNDLAVVRPRQFGPIHWRVNREEIAMQIAKIRASLPQEVKQADSITRESIRIVETAKEDAQQTMENARKEATAHLEQAKKEGELLIEQAKLEQQRLLSENEILKLAKAQAEEIRNSAERESTQMRRNADEYAYQVLNHLDAVVGKAVQAIERGKAELNPPQTRALVESQTEQKERASVPAR